VKIARILLVSATLGLGVAVSGCVERVVERPVTAAPPPARVEVVPAPPGPQEVWVWQPGHWRWNGREYVWTPGRYVEKPVRTAQWVPPEWVPRGNGWVFVEGHWR
jgi:hypothetical protein